MVKLNFQQLLLHAYNISKQKKILDAKLNVTTVLSRICISEHINHCCSTHLRTNHHTQNEKLGFQKNTLIENPMTPIRASFLKSIVSQMDWRPFVAMVLQYTYAFGENGHANSDHSEPQHPKTIECWSLLHWRNKSATLSSIEALSTEPETKNEFGTSKHIAQK